jgi:hypothetical protein
MSDQKRGERTPEQHENARRAIVDAFMADINPLLPDPSDGPGEGVLTRWEPPSEAWPKGRVVEVNALFPEAWKHDNGDTDMAAYAAVHEAYAPEVAAIEARLQAEAIEVPDTMAWLEGDRWDDADPYAGVSEEDMQAASDAFSVMMARMVERRRLERAVIDAALSKRRAARDFAANRVGHQTLQDAQTSLNEACDALAAFLEGQGEDGTE